MQIPRIEFSTENVAEEAADRYIDLSKQAIAAAVKEGQLRVVDCSELSILLGDDEALRSLNLQWRGIDKPTNVLSFPGDLSPPTGGGDIVLGDIAISVDTLLREADAEAKSPDDHFRHLLVHGFLHLFGYDHEDDEDADRMENLEVKILASLGISNPYENTEDK